jgi:ferredoxin
VSRPELILLEEWGYPQLASREAPTSLQAEAQAAATACPTLALRLRAGKKEKLRS